MDTQLTVVDAFRFVDVQAPRPRSGVRPYVITRVDLEFPETDLERTLKNLPRDGTYETVLRAAVTAPGVPQFPDISGRAGFLTALDQFDALCLTRTFPRRLFVHRLRRLSQVLERLNPTKPSIPPARVPLHNAKRTHYS
jgi:hypothetical protein